MATTKDLEAVQSRTIGEVLPVDGQDATLLRKIDWRLVPIMFACYVCILAPERLYRSGTGHMLCSCTSF